MTCNFLLTAACFFQALRFKVWAHKAFVVCLALPSGLIRGPFAQGPSRPLKQEV